MARNGESSAGERMEGSNPAITPAIQAVLAAQIARAGSEPSITIWQQIYLKNKIRFVENKREAAAKDFAFFKKTVEEKGAYEALTRKSLFSKE